MRTWTAIAKIKAKTVQARGLCEFPTILSVSKAENGCSQRASEILAGRGLGTHTKWVSLLRIPRRVLRAGSSSRPSRAEDFFYQDRRHMSAGRRQVWSPCLILCDVWQEPWNRSPPPACIADQGSPCCVDLVDSVDAVLPQVPSYGSQQDDVGRDSSLISPILGTNVATANQEGDRSEVEKGSSTGNQLPVQGDPPSSTWDQIPVQGDSFLNENQGPATGGSSSTESQQPAQGDSLWTGAQFLDPAFINWRIFLAMWWWLCVGFPSWAASKGGKYNEPLAAIWVDQAWFDKRSKDCLKSREECLGPNHTALLTNSRILPTLYCT